MNLKEIKNKNEEELEEILSLIKWDKENPNPFGYGNPNEDTLKSSLSQAEDRIIEGLREEVEGMKLESKSLTLHYEDKAYNKALTDVLSLLKVGENIKE